MKALRRYDAPIEDGDAESRAEPRGQPGRSVWPGAAERSAAVGHGGAFARPSRGGRTDVFSRPRLSRDRRDHGLSGRHGEDEDVLRAAPPASGASTANCRTGSRNSVGWVISCNFTTRTNRRRCCCLGASTARSNQARRRCSRRTWRNARNAARIWPPASRCAEIYAAMPADRHAGAAAIAPRRKRRRPLAGLATPAVVGLGPCGIRRRGRGGGGGAGRGADAVGARRASIACWVGRGSAKRATRSCCSRPTPPSATCVRRSSGPAPGWSTARPRAAPMSCSVPAATRGDALERLARAAAGRAGRAGRRGRRSVKAAHRLLWRWRSGWRSRSRRSRAGARRPRSSRPSSPRAARSSSCCACRRRISGPMPAMAAATTIAAAQAARRRVAAEIARDNGLELVEGWPMPLVGVDCYVMRRSATGARSTSVIEQVSRHRDGRLVAAAATATRPSPRPRGRSDPLFAAQPAACAWQLADLHRRRHRARRHDRGDRQQGRGRPSRSRRAVRRQSRLPRQPARCGRGPRHRHRRRHRGASRATASASSASRPARG